MTLKNKFYLIAFLLAYCSASYAQTPLVWSLPNQVSTNTGFNWPRVCSSKGITNIVWGDGNFNKAYDRTFNNGIFGAEQQVSPNGLDINVFDLTGPDVESREDTVYLVYSDISTTHNYLQKSFDGGNTFSDTVRIDHLGNNFVQYPSVAFTNNGNPLVTFAILDSNFSNPQYSISHSTDWGNSFSPSTAITNSFGADPCDCCPGDLLYHNDTVALVYRNAIANVRDLRAALSFNGGNSFTQLSLIDTNHWIIANCPSSGGQSVMIGDTLVSVFMNGVNGKACFISALYIPTNQLIYEKRLSPIGAGSQNNARIVASGDTIGVVWEQFIDGAKNILFSYSLHGPFAIGNQIDTLTKTMSQDNLINPDIAYDHGKFFVVFGNPTTHHVYLMEGLVYQTLGIATIDSQNSINAFYQSNSNSIEFQVQQPLTDHAQATLVNISGEKICSVKFSVGTQKGFMPLEDSVVDGVYVLIVSDEQQIYTSKIVVIK